MALTVSGAPRGNDMADMQKTGIVDIIQSRELPAASPRLKHVLAFALVIGLVVACAQGPDPGTQWIPGRVVAIDEVAPSATNVSCPARRAVRIDHLRGGTHTTGTAVLSATDNVQIGQRIYFVHMDPCKGIRLSTP